MRIVVVAPSRGWGGGVCVSSSLLPCMGGKKEHVQDCALEQIRNEGYNHKSTVKIYI